MERDFDFLLDEPGCDLVRAEAETLRLEDKIDRMSDEELERHARELDRRIEEYEKQHGLLD